jgi:ferric iron reductase protein FhuF
VVTRRAEPEQVAWSLRRTARVGAFFDLPAGPVAGAAGCRRPGSGWYRHADLTASAGAPVLTAAVADHARRLRVGEQRVAASLLFQGYAGRLWSPVLGCLRDGVVPDLDPSTLWLRCRAGESVVPWLAAVGGWVAPADPCGLVAEVVLDRLLAPMVDALRRVTPVAAGLLWGNAASALAGAMQVLTAHDPRPAVDGAAASGGGAGGGVAGGVVARLLRTGPLAGTGTLADRGGRPAFRRRGCCLYYRAPGGGLCADCGLTRAPARVTPGD